MRDIKEWVIDFLEELFGGIHHIPGGLNRIKEHGTGYELNFHPSRLATYDFNQLTTLVLMAHRDCIRVDIAGSGPNMIKLILHKRSGRDGKQWERHPTIDKAIELFNK